MYRVKAQIQNGHTNHGYSDEVFDNEQDALLAAINEADEYAEYHDMDVFHNMDIGLSTAYDPDETDQYACFWTIEVE